MHILIDRPKGGTPDFLCGHCGAEYPGGVIYFSEEEQTTGKCSCLNCGAYDIAHRVKSNHDNDVEDLAEKDKLIGELRHSVKIQADMLVQQADMPQKRNMLENDLHFVLNIPMGGDIIGAVRALQDERKRYKREMIELRKAIRCDDESYTNKLQRRIDRLERQRRIDRLGLQQRVARRDETITRLEKDRDCKEERITELIKYQAGIKKDRAERDNLQKQVAYKEAVRVALQDRVEDMTDQRDALQGRNDRQAKRLRGMYDQTAKALVRRLNSVKKQLKRAKREGEAFKATIRRERETEVPPC